MQPPDAVSKAMNLQVTQSLKKLNPRSAARGKVETQGTFRNTGAGDSPIPALRGCRYFPKPCLASWRPVALRSP